MRAYLLIRDQPHYRREAFAAGLKAVGYRPEFRDPPPGPAGSDLLVTWNRYGYQEGVADRFEAAGGTVIVAENGYLDPDRHGARRWYALALGGHNGQGRWSIGTPERWPRIAPQLGAELKPWRATGDHVLVCPNRPFGRRGHVMPADWAEKAAQRLRQATKRPVRIRPHPNNDKPAIEIEKDLRDCHAMAIWSSSAGVKALLAGIPVLCDAPAWILKGATSRNLAAPELPDRAPSFERLAWAQWHVEEIARGEPFRRLLSPAGKG